MKTSHHPKCPNFVAEQYKPAPGAALAAAVGTATAPVGARGTPQTLVQAGSGPAAAPANGDGRSPSKRTQEGQRAQQSSPAADAAQGRGQSSATSGYGPENITSWEMLDDLAMEQEFWRPQCNSEACHASDSEGAVGESAPAIGSVRSEAQGHTPAELALTAGTLREHEKQAMRHSVQHGVGVPDMSAAGWGFVPNYGALPTQSSVAVRNNADDRRDARERRHCAGAKRNVGLAAEAKPDGMTEAAGKPIETEQQNYDQQPGQTDNSPAVIVGTNSWV